MTSKLQKQFDSIVTNAADHCERLLIEEVQRLIDKHWSQRKFGFNSGMGTCSLYDRETMQRFGPAHSKPMPPDFAKFVKLVDEFERHFGSPNIDV
jgi:hypothetical protein